MTAITRAVVPCRCLGGHSVRFPAAAARGDRRLLFLRPVRRCGDLDRRGGHLLAGILASRRVDRAGPATVDGGGHRGIEVAWRPKTQGSEAGEEDQSPRRIDATDILVSHSQAACRCTAKAEAEKSQRAARPDGPGCNPREDNMRHLKTGLLGAALAAAAFGTPAFAQDKSVTIVLSEELDVVEPCMASRSNIGRVLLQNISETMTELDTRGGGLKPRLAESWEAVDEQHLALQAAAGGEIHRRVRLRRRRRRLFADAHHQRQDHLRDRRQVFRRHEADDRRRSTPRRSRSRRIRRSRSCRC